jgi:hypothetical protein
MFTRSVSGFAYTKTRRALPVVLVFSLSACITVVVPDEKKKVSETRPVQNSRAYPQFYEYDGTGGVRYDQAGPNKRVPAPIRNEEGYSSPHNNVPRQGGSQAPTIYQDNDEAYYPLYYYY